MVVTQNLTAVPCISRVLELTWHGGSVLGSINYAAIKILLTSKVFKSEQAIKIYPYHS